MHATVATTGECPYLFDRLDILAHLFFATGTADTVSLAWAGGVLRGELGLPEHGGVELRHAPGAPTPPVGAAVFVEYDGPSDHYRFETLVTGVEIGNLLLDYPETIECADRRLSLRLALDADSPVCLWLQHGDRMVAHRVTNLSDGGVAFVRADSSPPAGELDGVLELGPALRIPLRLEPRHAREEPDGLHVGARFVAMSLVDRGLLARFLWSDRRHELDAAT